MDKKRERYYKMVCCWAYSVQESILSFIRGVWEGDGTVGYYKTGPVAKVVSASKNFLLGIIRLCDNFNFKIYGNRLYTLTVVGGRKHIIRFWQWMYSHKGNLYLERKYEKVQNYIC